jgi:hypothetical protein
MPSCTLLLALACAHAKSVGYEPPPGNNAADSTIDVVCLRRHEYAALLADRAALRALRELQRAQQAQDVQQAPDTPYASDEAAGTSSSARRMLYGSNQGVLNTHDWSHMDPTLVELDPAIVRGVSESRPAHPMGGAHNAFSLGTNCSVTADEDKGQCQLQENPTHVSSCVSWAMCALADHARAQLMSGMWWRRSMHFLPNGPRPDTRLLVPIQKLAPISADEQARASMRPVSREYRSFDAKYERRTANRTAGAHHHGGSSASTAASGGTGGHHHAHSTDDLEAAAAMVAAAPLVWRSWPARAHYDDKHMAWERFPDGETWRGCRTGGKAHWYCNHISADYFETVRPTLLDGAPIHGSMPRIARA